MESLLVYLIGAVGCTIVLTTSSICAPLRKTGCRLLLRYITPCPFYCSMCSGFWVGLLVGAAYAHKASSSTFDFLVLTLLFGFATSVCAHGFSWWLRSKGHFTEPEHDGWKYGDRGGFEDLSEDPYEEID